MARDPMIGIVAEAVEVLVLVAAATATAGMTGAVLVVVAEVEVEVEAAGLEIAKGVGALGEAAAVAVEGIEPFCSSISIFYHW
jgi:hypothetical protein